MPGKENSSQDVRGGRFKESTVFVQHRQVRPVDSGNGGRQLSTVGDYVSVVADRFVELSVIKKNRKLTKTERYEKRECLEFLEKRQWELAKLGNFLRMATMTGDKAWEHHVCTEIVKTQMGVKKQSQSEKCIFTQTG